MYNNNNRNPNIPKPNANVRGLKGLPVNRTSAQGQTLFTRLVSMRRGQRRNNHPDPNINTNIFNRRTRRHVTCNRHNNRAINSILELTKHNRSSLGNINLSLQLRINCHNTSNIHSKITPVSARHHNNIRSRPHVAKYTVPNRRVMNIVNNGRHVGSILQATKGLVNALVRRFNIKRNSILTNRCTNRHTNRTRLRVLHMLNIVIRLRNFNRQPRTSGHQTNFNNLDCHQRYHSLYSYLAVRFGNRLYSFTSAAQL